MGVNDINFLNLKTKLRISSLEAAVSRKTFRYLKYLNKDDEVLAFFRFEYRFRVKKNYDSFSDF